eukprot:Hpha_TRINITY_DN34614_c0_g1::TRINITY_DN34614_c0_g1_i1::g.21064::m.21064
MLRAPLTPPPAELLPAATPPSYFPAAVPRNFPDRGPDPRRVSACTADTEPPPAPTRDKTPPDLSFLAQPGLFAAAAGILFRRCVSVKRQCGEGEARRRLLLLTVGEEGIRDIVGLDEKQCRWRIRQRRRVEERRVLAGAAALRDLLFIEAACREAVQREAAVARRQIFAALEAFSSAAGSAGASGWSSATTTPPRSRAASRAPPPSASLTSTSPPRSLNP